MHLRHLNSFSPPPPPPPFQTLNITNNKSRDTHSSSNINPSFLIVAIILFLVFIISAGLHFLLRYLNHHNHNNNNQENDVAPPQTTIQEPRISTRRVAPETNNNNNNHQTLINSLPIFSYNRLLLRSTNTRSLSAGDCAVCLSKFESHDQLRLLPLCCHAFHLTCIDTWLESNHTCPLCRSTIHVQESDQYKKLFQETSFRVQMGNVSSRRTESDRRTTTSYSIGSFEYLVDDDDSAVEEVVLENKKEEEEEEEEHVTVAIPVGPGDDVAGEVGGGRGWLKDYVDRLASSVSSNNSSSISNSLRFSGRFFTGSSRRSTTGSSRRRSITGDVNNGGSWDLEGNAYGEEIGNFLRWLSGV